ncbi:hypothetical protein GC194_13535, partial [bacterium]|nr:hypothetical protein [bacterium]
MITSEIDLLQWLASGTQRFAWERVSSIRWKDSGQAAQILRQCKQQGYIAEAEEVDYLLYKKLDPKERYIRLTQKGYKHLQKAHTTYLTEEFNRNKLLK